MKRPASAFCAKRSAAAVAAKKRPAAAVAAKKRPAAAVAAKRRPAETGHATSKAHHEEPPEDVQIESGRASVTTLAGARPSSAGARPELGLAAEIVAAYPAYPNQNQSLFMCAVSERFIWASGRDKHVRMFDMKLGREVRHVKLSHLSHGLHSLIAIPSGGFLGAHIDGGSSSSGRIMLFDEAGKITMELLHKGWTNCRSIAIQPDSKDGFPILIGTCDDANRNPSEHSVRVFDSCGKEFLTVSCGVGDIVGVAWLLTGQMLIACDSAAPPGSRGAKPKQLKIFSAHGDLQQTIECGRLLCSLTALPNGNFAVGLRHKIAVYGCSLPASTWTELSCAAVEPWRHESISKMVPIASTNESHIIVQVGLKAWVVELGSQRQHALFHLSHPGFVGSIAVAGKYAFTSCGDHLRRFKL